VFFMPLLILDSDRCVLYALAFPTVGAVVFFLPRLILDSDRCVFFLLLLPRLGLLWSFCPCFSYSQTVVFFLPLLFL
jgi:hypothetical protein